MANGVGEAARRSLRRLARASGLTAPQNTAVYRTLRTLRPWSPGAVVFDVGANDGRTVATLTKVFPQPRIFAFEPVGATFDVLRERTARTPGVETFRLALGAAPGRPTIHLNPLSETNSLYPSGEVSGGTETVEMTTLDAFAEDHAVGRIDLLKVDAEGHDLEVLKGGARMLGAGRVGAVVVEAGFGAPGSVHPRLTDIQEHLRPLNFHLFGVFNQCRAPYAGAAAPAAGESTEVGKALTYCDALFVNWPAFARRAD